MDIDILSLFPEYFEGPFDVSIIKRAKEKGLISINHINIRNFSDDKKHQTVDDRPFGGGPGMVLMAQPVCVAIRSVKRSTSHVIYLSPQGTLLNAEKCRELAQKEHLILLCGHYEGIDERAIEKEVDEEISIGDYVLTNGCAAAIVLVDVVSRKIPGVVGHPEAVNLDSFEEEIFDGPHYTRPELFEGMEVPAVLREGNHAKIAQYRLEKAAKKTQKIRPDLYSKYLLKKQRKEGEMYREPRSNH